LMVHASLFEAFGLAIIEACVSGLPGLTHNAAHFRWLVANPACSIDMSRDGELSTTLENIIANPQQLQAMHYQHEAQRRFDWSALKPDYIQMYYDTLALPESNIGVADQYGLH